MKGSITSLVRKRKGKLRYSIGYILLLFISFGCSGVNETVSHQNDDVYYAEKGASIDTADTNEYRDSGKVDYKNGQTGKIGAFMGHVMKHSEEAIKDPRRADHRIRQRLEEEIKASQEKNE